MENLKNILKSLLFVSNNPLTLKQFKEVLGEIDIKDIKLALEELKNDTEDSFQVIEIAEGYQMTTREKYSLWIRKLFQSNKRSKLSTSALETLAIIAYRQPIIKSEIEHIRGVDSTGVIQNLLEKNLIKITGKKKGPGHPFLYGTTLEFLSYFGLKDISCLPKLSEEQKII